MRTELFVELVVPDTEAITTLKTLQQMGFGVKKVLRRTYYRVEADEYIYDKLAGNDLLVNVNKHKSAPRHVLPDDGFIYFTALVLDPKNHLGEVLSKECGVPVEDFSKGTIWILGFTSQEEADLHGREIVNKLLYNKHFQEVELW